MMNIIEIMKQNQGYYSNNRDMPSKLQEKAKFLCWKYNQTSPLEKDKRQSLLQAFFGECHPLTFIEPSFRCDYGFNIHTHGLTVINYNCVILDTSPVHIGENTFIGPGACLACAGHAIDAKQRATGVGTSAPINIGRDVWLGANVTICGGVKVGEGSIIGAGSVVTKNIPAGVIAVGNPCKVLRPVTEEDKLQPMDF